MSLRRLFVAASLVASACGVSPSPECLRYVECSEAVTPGAGELLEAAYGQTGSCWQSGPGAADSCTRACRTQLDSLREQHPSVPACQ